MINDKNMWMVRAGRGGYLFDEFRNKEIVAIGWNETMNLSDILTKEEVIQIVKKVYPHYTSNKLYVNAGQISRFRFDFKKGDNVITYDPLERIYLIGEIIGDYEYNTLLMEYYHVHKVKWLGNVLRDKLSISTKNTLGGLTTVFKINYDSKKEIINLLKGDIVKKEEIPQDVSKEYEFTKNIKYMEYPIVERRIFTEQGDPEIDSLHRKYKRGKLIIQPEFQRHFVWDAKKSSRLIESALLDIPLPAIYLYEESNGKEIIIDGQQRLTAFFSFIDGKFPDERTFKLTGLKEFRRLNRKSFNEIGEELQDKILYCKIRTIAFKRESDEDLKYEIFERLNTGAVLLNFQELRNCIYRGLYNELLKELSKDNDFMYILGLKEPHKRMKDIELVLRFAAFYHSTYLNYKPPMRRFLDTNMEKYQNISESDASELRGSFKNAVSIIRSLLDTSAFKRFYRGSEENPNGYWEPKKFNASLYDILMFSFAKVDKHKVFQNLDSIREALIYVMTNDQDFIDSILIATSQIPRVKTRFNKWIKILDDIIGVDKKEPRCFSSKLKQQLYDTDPTCSICHQKIQNIDDAAIDHIVQYWTGGKTIPENARLTHRFCNWARPKKD